MSTTPSRRLALCGIRSASWTDPVTLLDGRTSRGLCPVPPRRQLLTECSRQRRWWRLCSPRIDCNNSDATFRPQTFSVPVRNEGPRAQASLQQAADYSFLRARLRNWDYELEDFQWKLMGSQLVQILTLTSTTPAFQFQCFSLMPLLRFSCHFFHCTR